MSQPQEEREMEVQAPPVLRKYQSHHSGMSQGELTHSSVTKTMIHVAHHHGTPYGQNWQKYSPKQNKCVSIDKQVKNQQDLEQLRPKK